MNAQTFKSLLKPEMASFNIKDNKHMADLLSTAYDLANIGTSGTIFGSKILKGNKETLKSLIEKGFELNFKGNTNEGFSIVASGFSAYWVGSTFTPMPPMPPMTTPGAGTIVIFPGNPKGLSDDLKMAFAENDDFEKFASKLVNALVKFHLTIAGTYAGFIGWAPMVLPWSAIMTSPERIQDDSGAQYAIDFVTNLKQNYPDMKNSELLEIIRMDKPAPGDNEYAKEVNQLLQVAHSQKDADNIKGFFAKIYALLPE